MSRRSERVEDVLRGELFDLLLRELRDPRVHGASIAAVDVSPDLRHAVVKVSVMGEEARRLEAIEALEHARGFIRSRLARRLRHLRHQPALHFELDRGAEHSARMSEILETLHDQDDPA